MDRTPHQTKRIVTLIASATEIVAALGRSEWLVGCSHECDYPLAVRDLPQLTEAKFDLSGSSAQIDDKVRSVISEGLSVYRVFEDELERLRPDIIVTQDHCEVCAVSLSDVENAVCSWKTDKPAGTKIISLKPDSLSDIYNDIIRVAKGIDAQHQGRELVASMQNRFSDLEARTKSVKRPRTAFIEWSRPLMSGGNWMPDLIRFAGGDNLFGTPGEHSVTMDWSDMARANPDIIILAPCGYDLEASVRDVEMLESYPGWFDVKAITDGRLYCCDGNAYFNRPGPRLADTAEIIAEILHPDLFEPRHEGDAWIRITPD